MAKGGLEDRHRKHRGGGMRRRDEEAFHLGQTFISSTVLSWAKTQLTKQGTRESNS